MSLLPIVMYSPDELDNYLPLDSSYKQCSVFSSRDLLLGVWELP